MVGRILASILLMSILVGTLSQAAADEEADQTIEKITQNWKQRRARFDSLRFSIEGELLIPKGAKPAHLLDEGESPPRDKDFRAPYLEAGLFDFRNSRIRNETSFPAYDPRKGTGKQSLRLRAFDGTTNRVAFRRNEAAEPDAPKYVSTIPGPFQNYGLVYPVLLASGYTPPQQIPLGAQHLLLAYMRHELNLAPKENTGKNEVRVLKAAPPLERTNSYDEISVDPLQGDRIVRHRQFISGSLISANEIKYEDDWKNDRPTEFTFTSFKRNGKIDQKITAKIRKWEINVPAENPDFVLTESSKAMILDETSLPK
jgi:hypothetical protein